MRIAVLGDTKNVNKYNNLFAKGVEIAFFLDNNPQSSKNTINNIRVYSPYNFPEEQIDYIIIFAHGYEVINQELVDLGITDVQIINFNDPYLDFAEYQSVFILDSADDLRLKMKIEYLERRVKELEEYIHNFEQNYMYEIKSQLAKDTVKLPDIYSIEETYKKILSDKCSVSRYGDGEFEIILGNKADFQEKNEILSRRLADILRSNLSGHIVAIADDYGSMTELRCESRNTIRKYMTEKKRDEHYQLLDMNRKYYNAYISRPYVIYPHDAVEQAQERFRGLQKIWNGRDILVIEGDKTRMGVGNDLFYNVNSVKRILAPNENAFCVYDKILDAALHYGVDTLILIALGPTATILAYDLAKAGYWALDIGHLDLEYEWFLKGRGYSYIPHKYNNEVMGDSAVTSISDENYDKSVVRTIEC